MSVKDQIVSFLVTYGFQILGGIVILVCGFFVAQFVGNLVKKFIFRFELEPPIRALMVNLTRALIIALTGVLTVAKMGVDIAPLVAGMGVIGVGIGLATQGVLSNMIAGLTIMFTKPFRVGEYIELLGVDGVVDAINLFSTRLQHFDKSVVVIPNRKIVGEILHNYGMIRQLDLSIGVSYDTNLDRAENVIRKALSENTRVLPEPPPVIGVSDMGDACILFSVKPWVRVPDFVLARGELNSGLIRAVTAAGIDMPFPQREIRIVNDAEIGARIAGRVPAGL